MKPLLVCDLDGTLCDDTHRAHLAVARQWEAYHDRLEEDVPCKGVWELVRLWAMAGRPILFLTGRPARYRARTTDWLHQHGFPPPYEYTLLMRPDDSKEITETVKMRLLQAFLTETPVYEVVVILEDLSRMVNVFRHAGFTCLQVKENNQ